MIHDCVIDIPQGMWRTVVVTGFATTLAAVTVKLLGLNSTAMQLAIVFAIFGGPFALDRWAAARMRRAIRRSHRAPAPEDFRVYAESILSYYPRSVAAFGSVNRKGSPLKDLAREALDRLGAGVVVRLASGAELLPDVDEPLVVEFEPMPFSERDPGFAALVGEPPKTKERIQLALEMITQFYGKSRAVRYVVVALMVVGWLILAGVLFDALQKAASGRVPDIVAPFGAALILVACSFALAGLRPQAWFLVPGGVVVRESDWGKRDWELHLFTPRDAAVVLWRDLNMLAVAGGDGLAYSRTASPSEMELLLRVWRSPLAAPPVEQLSDLR